ncbi:methyltransferase OMS1 [Botrytis cinerea]
MEIIRKRMIHTGLRVNRLRCLNEINRSSNLFRHSISTTAVRTAKQKPQIPKRPSRPQQQYKTPSPRQVLNPTPPPPPPPPAEQHPLRGRKFALIGSSIAALIFAGYSSYLFVLLNKEPTESSSSKVQADVSSRYDTIASTFDSEVDWTEWSMGITKMRKKLAQEAHGDVLEVSIGTGRNLEYYDWDFKGFNGVGKIQKVGGIKKGKVKSFTAVDKSGEMLEVAHEKFSTMPPRNANETSGNKDAKYDTVIQTMGLCSVADPVGLLKNLGECVKEEEGRILLLEHGRAKWDWLNRALDNSAEGHAKLFGCWWNRDLGKIVEESGLEVVNIKRRHGGTTWRIELKKPKATPKDSGVGVATEEKTQQASRKGWW